MRHITANEQCIEFLAATELLPLFPPNGGDESKCAIVVQNVGHESVFAYRRDGERPEWWVLICDLTRDDAECVAAVFRMLAAGALGNRITIREEDVERWERN